MTIVERFKPAVSKRILFAFAAIIWGIAAYRVLTIGIGDILDNTSNQYIYFLIGSIGGYFFFSKVFLNIYKRNVKRIINSNL